MVASGSPGCPARRRSRYGCGAQVASEGVDPVAEPIRVVVAKPGLDGHDRGVKIVARALRDAGMEVIYLGLRQTPEMIVETAIQEDADAVGLSILSGAHMTLFPRVVQLLRERGAEDVLVFGGGIVPADDIAELKRLGVAEIFTPGAPTGAIVEWLRAALGEPAGADVAD
jgi:methylmalonyl-CoA mutase, C-terminal domain